MNDPAYETINSFRQESQDMRNMNNPVYHSESGIAAAMIDDGYAEIGQTSRNQVARLGHVTTAGGLNPRTALPLHPRITENSASVGKDPSPYLMPQPSLGKENRIIKECYKIQTTKQLASGRFAAYTNIVAHVVPTDPQTGYSTLLRPDEVQSPSVNFNPIDPLYDSIKEKDKCVLAGPSGDKVVAQMCSPCSMSPSDAILKPQGACPSDNPGEHIYLYESTIAAQVFSPEIVAPVIDNPGTDYSVLRPNQVLVPPPGPGTGSVLPYDTIKLNSGCSVKQQKSDGDMSHSNTSSMLTLSPRHNTTAIQLEEPVSDSV